MSQSEQSALFDSLAVVARRADGSIKDARFLHSFAGKVWQFKPNRLYLKLVNSGDLAPDTWKIPFIFGNWSVVNG